MTPRRLLSLVAAVWLALSGTAGAHGDVVSTLPPQGSKLDKPPPHIIINFAEPPTKNGIVKVFDGCKKDVVDSFTFTGKAAHIFLGKGQPGKWKVSYRVVSDVDGHQTSGSYALTVTGQPDCSKESPDDGGQDDDQGEGPPTEGTAGQPPGEDEGSGLPVVPIALGSVAVIVLAIFARRAAS